MFHHINVDIRERSKFQHSRMGDTRLSRNKNVDVHIDYQVITVKMQRTRRSSHNEVENPLLG
jgi:hypothetical protein